MTGPRLEIWQIMKPFSQIFHCAATNRRGNRDSEKFQAGIFQGIPSIIAASRNRDAILPQPLDTPEIDKIATLARLRVSPGEAGEVAARVSEILGLIDQMQAVDTEGVEPLAHPLDAVQRLRADEVSETDRREELLALAPASRDGLFLVPKVIE